MEDKNNEYIVTLHIDSGEKLTSFLLCELLSKQDKVRIEGILCLTPIAHMKERNYMNVINAIKHHQGKLNKLD